MLLIGGGGVADPVAAVNPGRIAEGGSAPICTPPGTCCGTPVAPVIWVPANWPCCWVGTCIGSIPPWGKGGLPGPLCCNVTS